MPQKFNLRTKQNFVKHMHYNSVAFFHAYQIHPIENGILSVFPHVIFSAYEIIQ